jgi:hypothetical protein
MRKQECVEYYGKYEYITYKAFHNDFHRSRWIPGDWTDDTGIYKRKRAKKLILLLQTK